MTRTVPVTSFRLALHQRGWGFAAEHRARVTAHWAEITARNPSLWNGEILICTGASAEQGHFEAELTKTDYASFVAWRDWGRPDTSVRNCFGAPAAFSSDGALLVGVMAPWTLNAGKAYPPSGTLEPKDVLADGTVDVLGSMRTELLEETGLDIDAAAAGETVAIFEGPRLGLVRRFDFPLRFAEMEEIFVRHQAAEEKPELERIEAMTSADQIDSRMPGYAQEIARYFLK